MGQKKRVKKTGSLILLLELNRVVNPDWFVSFNLHRVLGRGGESGMMEGQQREEVVCVCVCVCGGVGGSREPASGL